MMKGSTAFLRDRSAESEEAGCSRSPAMAAKPTSIKRGKLTTLRRDAAAASHKVNSVDDLIEAAQKWNASPVVWINGDAIVLDSGRCRPPRPGDAQPVKSAAFPS
jgi:hypothetical protein